MKKTFIRTITVGLLLVPSVFSFSKVNKEQAVLADAPTQVYLGWRAVTVSGDIGVKTYIAPNEVERFIDTGRTVYSQIPGQPPVIESVGHSSKGLGPLKSYFYYPTYDLPKISHFVDLYNSWDSVTFMVGELEKRILELSPTSTTDEINYYSLAFLRSLNSHYNGDNWTMCAGSLSNNSTFFYSLANEGAKNGTKILDFFVPFLMDESDFNANLYNSLLCLSPEDGVTIDIDDVFINDYLDTSHGYDLIHMFASANCFVYDSVAAQLNYDSVEVFLDALTSWGADLQCATDYYSYNNLFPNSFDHILNNSSAGFDWCDFYADIDSNNLIKYGLPLATNHLVSESLYLLQQLSTSSRFSNFASSINYLLILSFEDYVESMLALDPVFPNFYESFIDGAHAINVYPPDIYIYLKQLTGTLPSVSLRQCFAGLFITRITQLAGY